MEEINTFSLSSLESSFCLENHATDQDFLEDMSDLSTIGEDIYLDESNSLSSETVTYDEIYYFFHFEDFKIELETLDNYEYFV